MKKKPPLTEKSKPGEMHKFALQVIEAIEKLEELQKTPLKKEAIVLLIQGITKQSQTDIKRVLDAIEVLKNVYIKEIELEETL